MRKITLMYGTVNIVICLMALIRGAGDPIYPTIIIVLTLFLLIFSFTSCDGKPENTKIEIGKYRIVESMDKFIIEMYGYNSMINPWGKGWIYIGTHNTLEEAQKFIKLLNKKAIIHEVN